MKAYIMWTSVDNEAVKIQWHRGGDLFTIYEHGEVVWRGRRDDSVPADFDAAERIATMLLADWFDGRLKRVGS